MLVEAETGSNEDERFLKIVGEWYGSTDIEACLKFGKEQGKVHKMRLGPKDRSIKQIYPYK